MFIEINNTIQDTNKLERRRILIKKVLQQRIEEQLLNLGFEKLEDKYYNEETLQIINLKTTNLENYTEENFTF